MIRPTILSLLLLVAGYVGAGTDEAMTFYEKKDYARAYAEFMSLAEIGDSQAQFNIGVMHYLGQHVVADPVQAYAWMALAAQDESDKRIAAALADVTRQLGDEQRQQAEQARQELFARYSNAALAAQLAPDVERGAGNPDPARVIRRVPPVFPASMRSMRGDAWVDVLFTVAPDGTTRNHTVLYSSHDLFAASTIDSLKRRLYLPPTVDGRPVEIYGERTRVTYAMQGAALDERRARLMVESRRKKIESGTSAERYGFGYLLESLSTYDSLKPYQAEYNQWYLRAAQEGYGPAQFALAKNLLDGKACAADTVKSMRWLERAAAQGQADAQYLLAIEMLNGTRIGRNPEGAMKWLVRAADGRNQHAQLKLAWLYTAGTDAKLHDAGLGKAYVDKVGDEYADHLTLFETRAAVAAALGDFAGAAKWQKKAIAEAERYELPVAGFSAKLAAYEAGKPWIEPA